MAFLLLHNYTDFIQNLNVSTYDKIFGTDVRSKIREINEYINNFS